MRLLLFVVAGLVAATEAIKIDHNARLFASAMRIQRLHHEVEELDHEIDEAGKIDPFGFIKEMHARLDQVEESKCEPHYIQCGWQSFDCVSELLVCDGHSDCQNGWDESEETCSHGPIAAGNVFTGMADWTSCQTWLEHPMSLKITGVVTSKLYTSRLEVTAHVVGDVPHENIHFEGDLTGYYVYGSKRLILTPVHRKQHMVVTFSCDFNHGDDKRADCEIGYEASHFKCADVHLHLEHLDTHHTGHGGEHDVDHRGEIVEHHYDVEGHDHAEHFDRLHRRIAHEDDDHFIF